MTAEHVTIQPLNVSPTPRLNRREAAAAEALEVSSSRPLRDALTGHVPSALVTGVMNPHLQVAESEAPTATEWARRLKVSPSTVTRWALSGEVDHARVGRKIRITAEAMEACLSRRTEAHKHEYAKRVALRVGNATRRTIDAAEVEAELNRIGI
jgi:excisionase family DNA binding protein